MERPCAPFLRIMNSQDTFRAIFDHAPVGMAQVSLDGRWLEVNHRLCEMTGYSREELLATNFQQITHPDDLPHNVDALANFTTGGLERYSVDKRYIRKDGCTVWVRVSVAPMRDLTHEGLVAHESVVGFIAVIEEITEYKRAQELRLKAEEKCSKAFRQTPMAITLISLRDHRYLEVNDAFLRLTGFSREEVIGRTPFDLNLWVEPAQRPEMVEAILAGNRVEDGEYQFRTKDGRVVTVSGFAEAIEIDGESCYIGAALDITDRKRLETELHELTGRLIQAQDEERKRIAAELTDSLGQSVTVISFEACQLARSTQGGLGRDLQSLCAKIQDIASGLGILSQSLHPSGLDYTGLPWAIECLCRQFTHVYGLQVAFKHEGIPSFLSADVALVLYRIVQEGLRNVVQHSGTRKAWIELAHEDGNIRLELWDKGVGFDPASLKAGLGLLTMRERCRRLNGWLAVHNNSGTRIEVHIPLADVESDLFNGLLNTAPDQERAE